MFCHLKTLHQGVSFEPCHQVSSSFHEDWVCEGKIHWRVNQSMKQQFDIADIINVNLRVSSFQLMDKTTTRPVCILFVRELNWMRQGSFPAARSSSFWRDQLLPREVETVRMFCDQPLLFFRPERNKHFYKNTSWSSPMILRWRREDAHDTSESALSIDHGNIYNRSEVTRRYGVKDNSLSLFLLS